MLSPLRERTLSASSGEQNPGTLPETAPAPNPMIWLFRIPVTFSIARFQMVTVPARSSTNVGSGRKSMMPWRVAW